MKNDVSKTFTNRVKRSADHEGECDRCGLPLVFALKTKSGDTFSVDLETILKCLEVAEQKGYTPEIDVHWWNNVRNHFNL